MFRLTLARRYPPRARFYARKTAILPANASPPEINTDQLCTNPDKATSDHTVDQPRTDCDRAVVIASNKEEVQAFTAAFSRMAKWYEREYGKSEY